MTHSSRRWRTWVAAIGCVAAAGLVSAGCSSSTQGGGGSSSASSTKKPTIALTMTYTGNSWGKSAQDAFVSVAKQLKAEGKIQDFYTSNANNDARTQAAQIDSYVLKKVDAIVVEPASPTALNSAIARAHAANIPVIIIETGPVTSKYAYELNPDVAGMGYDSALAAIKRMNGKGNMLYVQGVAGNPFTVDFKKGVERAAQENPGVKVINGPFGNWEDTTSQANVSSREPSLPKIDGLVSEGGVQGALQALVKAGRPVPVTIGDNRGSFLRWWAQYYQKTGGKYDTESLEANPWVGGAAVHVALDILKGENVPKKLTWPTLVIKDPQRYKDIEPTGVASQSYDANWVRKNVEGL